MCYLKFQTKVIKKKSQTLQYSETKEADYKQQILLEGKKVINPEQ